MKMLLSHNFPKNDRKKALNSSKTGSIELLIMNKISQIAKLFINNNSYVLNYHKCASSELPLLFGLYVFVYLAIALI